jgi:hypothetical protein
MSPLSQAAHNKTRAGWAFGAQYLAAYCCAAQPRRVLANTPANKRRMCRLRQLLLPEPTAGEMYQLKTSGSCLCCLPAWLGESAAVIGSIPRIVEGAGIHRFGEGRRQNRQQSAGRYRKSKRRPEDPRIETIAALVGFTCLVIAPAFGRGMPPAIWRSIWRAGPRRRAGRPC